jgi:hypothetical protein
MRHRYERGAGKSTGAHALKDLPLISEGFRKGELSYSKVRAMTRIADAKNEDYLIMIAKHGTAHHVEKLVAKYRGCIPRQDNQEANLQHMNRELTIRYGSDGCVIINARIPAEQGVLIVKAIELAMTQTAPPPQNEPCRSSSHERIPTEPTQPDVTAVTSTHINSDLSHLEDGPHVTAETSRRIACDCSIYGIITAWCMRETGWIGIWRWRTCFNDAGQKFGLVVIVGSRSARHCRANPGRCPVHLRLPSFEARIAERLQSVRI